jgi:membrane protease subunit HflK
MEARNEEPQATGVLRPEADGYTITADGNIIHVRARIKYRIVKELRYAFGFDNAAAILTNVVNEAIFFASSRFTADAALYKDKPGFRDAVLNRVLAQIEDLDLGVSLEPSDVETKAAADVRMAFEAVNAAEQDRSKAISDAQSYRNEITSKALGEAAVLVNNGITSSNRIVSEVGSLVGRFNELLPEHRKNRVLFENRLLTASMGRLLTNAQDKFLLPADPIGPARELRLQLSRPPLKREETEQRP